MEVKHDISIRFGAVDHLEKNGNLPDPYLKLTPDEAIFSIDHVGSFQITGGEEIIIQPDDQVDHGLLQRYLVGAGIAILLYQRGRLVLHASAVKINERGIAFLGASGAGKSSIATALFVRGHPLLVDDITAVELDRKGAWIHSGFPQLKLSAQAARVMDIERKGGHFLDDLEDKRSYRIDTPNAATPVELTIIYVITDGAETVIKPIPSQEAIAELVRYSIPPSLVRMNVAGHFVKCVELAKHIKFYRLYRSSSLEQLPELAIRLEKHCLAETDG